MELYGTAPSPFTRKVRIVLLELGLDCDFKLLTDLASVSADQFASNPLLQLPTLVDGTERVFDSSIICEYLIDTYGSKRSALVYLPKPESKFKDLQRLAILNGGMDAGVKIIRAARSDIPNFDQYTMFKQERVAIQDALAWLDKDLSAQSFYYAGVFSILEVTLQCFLDWAQFRNLIKSLDQWPNLKRFNEFHQTRPSLFKTHPAQVV
jgi:glutathione S-transferase